MREEDESNIRGGWTDMDLYQSKPSAALKASWTVTAGLAPSPELEIKELRRSWQYTSEDYEKDMAAPIDLTSTFAHMVVEASRYAESLQDPGVVNHVKLEFIWY